MPDPVPFPTDATARQDAFNQTQRTAIALRDFCESKRMKSLSHALTAYEIRDLLSRLTSAKAVFAAAPLVPGIAAYAVWASTDPDLTEQIVGDSFNNMLATVTAAIGWIETTLPKVTQGGVQYLAVETISTDGSGQWLPREFDPADLGGLRALLQAVEDSIGV